MTALHHSVRRLTVSAYELGCLGLLHGTRARVRRAMGRPDPEPVELTQQMLKRVNTRSLEVKPAWPRDLAIVASASLAAAAMIAVVAMAKPGPAEPTVALMGAPPAVEETTPAPTPTPVVAAAPARAEQPAALTPLEEPPAAKARKVRKNKKNKRAKKKRRRGRKRRRRR